jgi:glycosyltransferase involved in cell wall biosynthesis
VLYSAFDVVPSPKGASTHVRHFVRGLVRAGHEVVLVTPSAPGLAAAEPFEGARHVRVGQPGSGNYLARALEFGEQVLALAVREGPFDVAHFRALWSGLPLLLARAHPGTTTAALPTRLRLLFEANSLTSVELPFHYPQLRGRPVLEKLRRLERLVLEQADHIVCVSRVSRTFLIDHGAPAERLTVIPNGVDPRRFRAAPQASAHERIPVALYVGTWADWQGLAGLLEAWPGVLARRPVRLRLVGRGRARQRKELQRRVRKLGLEGFVSLEPPVAHDAVPALIAEADLCLAPLSYNERNVVQGCCPLKVLEYAACGRPVIAANLPVVRELLREEREAVLVPPDAPDALAAAVLRVLSEPQASARRVERARRRVQTHFTWRQAQSQLVKVYDRLLEATP